MKKLLALLMGLMLLCGIAASCAEGELPYMETVNQQMYRMSVLTEESCSQVCISPFGAYSLFESDREEPWYVTFPAPEGTVCCDFTVQRTNWLDAENAYIYYYEATESYSYETFLNRCKDESNIILDGSDKVAAYINPDYGYGYALLGLDEIKRGAKLYIQINMALYRQLPEDSRVQTLIDFTKAEAERIRANMACATQDKFWTDGKFQGVKLYSRSIPGMTVIQTLGQIDFHFDGETFSATPFITKVDTEEFSAYATEGSTKSVEIEAEVNTTSYVFYNREESEYTMVTLDDGSEWGVYVANVTYNEGKPFSVYASRVLRIQDDKPLYFNYHLTANSGNMAWADLDAFKADLNTLNQSLQFEGMPAD